MLEPVPNRRLLIVDPCDDCHRLLPGLRSVGWDVRTCTLATALEHPCDVGLLRLHASHLQHPDAVKDLISRSGTEWIAVLSAEELRAQNVGDFVCEWFFDFHTLPFDVSRVQVTLGRAFGMARLRGKGNLHVDEPEHELLGDSKPIRELRKLLSKLAPTESPVLIRGESGTGKELVARTLHRQSQRHSKPFVAINCGAIPEHLIQSELFGHEKGAFTGASAGRAGLVEAADGGTLFLDEIGELPLEAQARLLRVLQEGEIRRVGSVQSQKVDVRLIAATHRDLKSLAKIGQFREDLYYRLHVIALKLPALRERGADVNEIANAFLARQSARINRTDLKFAPDAEQAIRHYSWPGNVRELENAIERAVILCEGAEISADLLGIDIELDDLDDEDFGLPAAGGQSSGNSHEPTEDLSLEDYFQHFVLEHQDHMTETELARKLGVSRKCLWERRQRLGIPRRKSGATSES